MLKEAYICLRWVNPARRWHAFPATFDLFLLRGGFGDGSPGTVAAVLRRAVEANATLLLVDSFSGGGGDVAGDGDPGVGASGRDGEADGGGGLSPGIDLRQPRFGLPRPLQVCSHPRPDLDARPTVSLHPRAITLMLHDPQAGQSLMQITEPDLSPDHVSDAVEL